MKTKIISASETAYILRKHLGPIRAWRDFLTDNIRERQDVGGLKLTPCGKMKGRCKRPLYDIRDVAKFVAEVKAAGLAAVEPEKIKALDVELDVEIPWFLRIFDAEGRPVTLH